MNSCKGRYYSAILQFQQSTCFDTMTYFPLTEGPLNLTLYFKLKPSRHHIVILYTMNLPCWHFALLYTPQIK